MVISLFLRLLLGTISEVEGGGSFYIEAPVGGQVKIYTLGRHRTVPLDAHVIHEDVQDRV